MHESRLRMASFRPLDLEVLAGLLHLWLSLITSMVVPFITFMGKFYYICGWWVYYIQFLVKSYYIYGQFLFHLWLVLYLCFFFYIYG